MTDVADRTIREFLVPDLGEGLLDATIVEGLVVPGDTGTVNQPPCVLETAKAEMESLSPYAGTVVERRGEPGQTLPVGTPLTFIDSGAPAGTGRAGRRRGPRCGHECRAGHGRRRGQRRPYRR
ncbi:biotin/lipoyl-containing protein [Streptomyces sp. NBC_00572]|uniref:biotin/lipoyl-containing protein n=1 Tax=Streptomyces sp. NBC_00572 TaxID=2903664 RepID=UPI00224F9284|nr:biotin/lipoyl-containing protein [Streptomyces sp. NBC_00572]MCX4984063.1 hypothetical protein [Streptomyces sp. NBC_00572]